MAADVDAPFRCLRCRGPLERTIDRCRACHRCDERWPALGPHAGVEVLLSNPVGVLASYAAHAPEPVEVPVDESGAIAIDPSLPPAERLRARALAEQAADDALAERLFTPARHWLEHQSRPWKLHDFFATFSHGWSFDRLRPYFVRDWAGTDEAGALAALFRAAIAEHAHEAAGLPAAVLGCGAGGLVRDLDDLFPAVYGVDLAVPSLLLARALLDGEPLALHAQNLDPALALPWASRRIALAGRRSPHARLVAADAMNLPFADGSLGCVVTHHLLDLVMSHRALAAEVRRVLAAGGLWINLSPPGGWRTADQLTHLDPLGFLDGAGFAPLHASVRRAPHLDLSPLLPDARTVVAPALFFVARRGPEPIAPDGARAAFAAFFADGDPAVWSARPAPAPEVTFSITRRRDLEGDEPRAALGIRTRWGQGSDLWCPPSLADFLEWLLPMLDGERTLRAIHEAVQGAWSAAPDEREWAAIFQDLLHQSLIELRT